MQETIETTIDAVTVFTDRARIQRVGSAEITPNITQLIIENLPTTLDIDSLRAGGRGTAQVRIASVDVQKRSYRVTPAEKVQALQAELETLSAQLQEKADGIAVLQRQLDYLGGLTQETEQFARGLALGRSQVDGQLALLEFVQTREGVLCGEMRTLTAAKRELDKTYKHVETQLSQLRSQRQLQRYAAVVDVEVVEAGSFSAEITYVVKRAGWQPLYDVRLDEATNDITLTALAQVSQKTGEDWQDVALTFSTARPALNQKLPKLTPTYVDVRKPRPVAAARPAASRKMMARSRSAEPPSPEPSMETMMLSDMHEADVVEATVSTAGANVTFHASGSADIPGDGSNRKSTLASYSLTPKLDYVAIPSKTDSVFRRATLVNSTDTPLLSGTLNLFVGSDFIGKNAMPFTARGDEVELLLGVEERITVERKLTRRDVDKRLLRDKRLIRYGYAIELKNLLDKTAVVTVEDQIPASRHESIKVSMESSKPQPLEQTPLNLVKWRLELPAEAARTIAYDYSVEHPRELDVVGLAK